MKCSQCDTSPEDCGWEIFIDYHDIIDGKVSECRGNFIVTNKTVTK
jgi:hypothetical protein